MGLYYIQKFKHRTSVHIFEQKGLEGQSSNPSDIIVK